MDVWPERDCCPSHRLPRSSDLPHLPELPASVGGNRWNANSVFDVFKCEFSCRLLIFFLVELISSVSMTGYWLPVNILPELVR